VVRGVVLTQPPNKRFASVEKLGVLTVFLASEAAASIAGVALPIARSEASNVGPGTAFRSRGQTLAC
jgi:hypothetical protein